MDAFLEVAHLSYKYSEEATRKALNDLSFSIQEGEWVAIIGPNGSGKSTLTKVITGLLEPDEGSVHVGGLILNEANVWNIRAMAGMVFQNPDNQFVGSTVQDDVAFGLENQGIERDEMIQRVHGALEKVHMLRFLDREPARLSGGQKQRVAIAGVVALQPKLIILDEATSMLDPKGRREVLDVIRDVKEQEGLTVLSITHDIDEAAQADRILVLKEGSLVQEGTPEEVFLFGEKLIEMGLEYPFSEQLKHALQQKGFAVPEGYLDEEGLVNWLWTLFSNK